MESVLRFKNDTANLIALRAVGYDLGKRINGKLNELDEVVEADFKNDKNINTVYKSFRDNIKETVKESKAKLIKIGGGFDFNEVTDLPPLIVGIKEEIAGSLKTFNNSGVIQYLNTLENGESFVESLNNTVKEIGIILQELEDSFQDFKDRKVTKMNQVMFEGSISPSAWSSILCTDWNNFDYFAKYVASEQSFRRTVVMLSELYGKRTERFAKAFVDNMQTVLAERTTEIVGKDLTSLLVPNDALDELLDKRLPEFVKKVANNQKVMMLLKEQAELYL